MSFCSDFFGPRFPIDAWRHIFSFHNFDSGHPLNMSCNELTIRILNTTFYAAIGKIPDSIGVGYGSWKRHSLDRAVALLAAFPVLGTNIFLGKGIFPIECSLVNIDDGIDYNTNTLNVPFDNLTIRGTSNKETTIIGTIYLTNSITGLKVEAVKMLATEMHQEDRMRECNALYIGFAGCDGFQTTSLTDCTFVGFREAVQTVIGYGKVTLTRCHFEQNWIAVSFMHRPCGNGPSQIIDCTFVRNYKTALHFGDKGTRVDIRGASSQISNTGTSGPHTPDEMLDDDELGGVVYDPIFKTIGNAIVFSNEENVVRIFLPQSHNYFQNNIKDIHVIRPSAPKQSTFSYIDLATQEQQPGEIRHTVFLNTVE